MRIRPQRLNAAIATLFVVGSACFVLGSIPAYATTVAGVVDGVTYFVGSLFFTTASFLQLLQAQSPSTTELERARDNRPEPLTWWRPLPHDRTWLAAIAQFPGTLFFNLSTAAALVRNATVQEQDRHVWRPDLIGSTLFLVASTFGVLALGRFRSLRPRSLPWQIAWFNMVGSIFFMASALASFILPSSGEVINIRVTIVGTLLGAVCFLIGAALMFPAWRRFVHDPRPAAQTT
ncbi:MAG TPA: hypothetical protein VIT65_15870 [Microlunatus sp.]